MIVIQARRKDHANANANHTQRGRLKGRAPVVPCHFRRGAVQIKEAAVPVRGTGFCLPNVPGEDGWLGRGQSQSQTRSESINVNLAATRCIRDRGKILRAVPALLALAGIRTEIGSLSECPTLVHDCRTPLFSLCF